LGEGKKRRGIKKGRRKKINSFEEDNIFHSRKHPRVQLEMEVEYKKGSKFERAVSHNISKGGMFIKSEEPLPEDKNTVVKFVIDPEKEPLKVRSRVAWTRGGEQSSITKQPPGMGVEFIFEDESERNMIREFVRDLFDLLRIMAITQKKKTDN